MKAGRWIDHLCPWIVWGGVASTGIYEPWELLAMSLPLIFAATLEARRADLSGWRRSLEWGALALLVVDAFITRNFLGSLVRVLFVLMGLRLALPRQRRERRQLLLMAFLLFLTTAVSTTDLMFLGASLAFLAGTAVTLLHLNWEESASLRRGPSPQAPFRKLVTWSVGMLVLATLAFLAMPRVTIGLRPFSFIRRGMLGSAAGLSDGLDLGKEGPIQSNGTAVLRVAPTRALSPEDRARWAEELGLLRGLALEEVKGMVWQSTPRTPRAPLQSFIDEGLPRGDREAEFFLLPSRNTLFTVPYGLQAVKGPLPLPLRAAEGGGLRWGWLPSQGFPLRLTWSSDLATSRALKEDRPASNVRWNALTQLGPEHEAARRASYHFAPGYQPAPELAQHLSGALRSRFKYTLTNPSGAAANPLEDFLENSHAGHCEYFASSLALMLRARGVPARVVNGYRLGPWVEQGGYFLVSEEQAHAWVEWWDEATGRWRAEDATPSAELRVREAQGLSTWERLADTLRYRWERYVVRFSDEDQEAGLGWARGQVEGWSWKRPGWPWLAAGGALLGLLLFRWFGPKLPRRGQESPGGLRELKPLLRQVPPTLKPTSGETAHAWFQRLADAWPERSRALDALARAVDALAYGGAANPELGALVKAEAKAWARRPEAVRKG
ncbi:MAG TPA: transglutaminaseTgpA domain-containing protein [Holophagaceae bacterium]|nr:transglutaminaseTgpA domain-containing protein [Holophagaceae bacterium]